MNERFGALIDLFEQETISGDAVEEFAEALEAEVANLRRFARGGVVRARIATRLMPEWIEVSIAELSGRAADLASFARELAHEGAALMVEM